MMTFMKILGDISTSVPPAQLSRGTVPSCPPPLSLRPCIAIDGRAAAMSRDSPWLAITKLLAESSRRRGAGKKRRNGKDVEKHNELRKTDGRAERSNGRSGSVENANLENQRQFKDSAI